MDLDDQTIAERDRAQEAADGLANAIAVMLDIEIGEHSNLNDPWTNALDAACAAIERGASVNQTAAWKSGIRHVELMLMRRLERPDVRKSDDEWNDTITALTQVRALFANELAT